jgi:hypothetical protein
MGSAWRCTTFQVPSSGRVWFREMLQDPDPRRQLERFAQLGCQVKRDWPEQRFTRWLADTFIHQLLR